ncbi:MAG: FG-GAP repeat domain-containing protein [Nitrospiria bacterium]
MDDPSAFENATVTLTQFLGPLRQPLSSTGTDEVILGALQINPSTSINLNGDVFNDLVARNRSQDKITFLVGLLNGFLLKPVVVSNPVAMVVGDFINEAQFVADIAALRVSPSGNDIVFISGGADDPTSFSPGLHPTTFPLPVSDGTPTLLAVGKYHESLPTNPNAPVSDLAVGTAEGDIAILLQNRNAPVPVSFNRSSSSPLSTGGTPTQLLSGDYNGDELGLDDLAVVRNNQSDLIIFIANSSGDFSGPLTVPTPSPIKSVVTADFNGDGIADLVAAHAAPPQLTVLLGIGDGGFAPAGTISLDSPPGAMAVGDFNFGGAADLAVALPDQGSILILFGDGTGQFIGKWLSPTTASPPPSLVAGCFIGTCANTGAQNFGLTYIEQSPSSTDQLVLLNNSIGPNNNP